MKRNLKYLLTTIMVFSLFSTVFAGSPMRKAGIGFRGSYWRTSKYPPELKVQQTALHSEVNVGGGGGSLYFLSRLSDVWLAELTLGAIGRVAAKTEYLDGEDVEVSFTTPLLLGFRHHLFLWNNSSALRPYVNFGAGPYWMHDLHVQRQNYGFQEEVSGRTKLKLGGYLGGGFDFMFTTWFGLNFDVRYHFIDFNQQHEHSGFEYGLGFQFLWGHFDG